jgi:hypothetical protein
LARSDEPALKFDQIDGERLQMMRVTVIFHDSSLRFAKPRQ